jgi:hypothetical protein
VIGVMVMMFNTTFNNISVLWWSVLLMEQTGVSGKKTRTVATLCKFSFEIKEDVVLPLIRNGRMLHENFSNRQMAVMIVR